MKQKLIDVLSGFGFPVLLKYSVAPDDYPSDVILFWNFDSDNTAYENSDYISRWGFEVTYFSTSPANVEKYKTLIRDELKKNGFVSDGNGYDIATDTSTSTRTGWRCDFYFMEVKK